MHTFTDSELAAHDAEVRADEREKAGLRVVAMQPEGFDMSGMATVRKNHAIRAASGLDDTMEWHEAAIRADEREKAEERIYAGVSHAYDCNGLHGGTCDCGVKLCADFAAARGESE